MWPFILTIVLGLMVVLGIYGPPFRFYVLKMVSFSFIYCRDKHDYKQMNAFHLCGVGCLRIRGHTPKSYAERNGYDLLSLSK